MVADLCFATFPTYQKAVKMSLETIAENREASQSASRETKNIVFCNGRRSLQMSLWSLKFKKTLLAIISNNYSYQGVYIVQQL